MTPDRVMSINAPKKWYHVIILKANKWPFSTWQKCAKQGKKKKQRRLALKKISVILINKAETNREI
jgi:hypothetical protein